jgi:hypothetical protein
MRSTSSSRSAHTAVVWIDPSALCVLKAMVARVSRSWWDSGMARVRGMTRAY